MKIFNNNKSIETQNIAKKKKSDLIFHIQKLSSFQSLSLKTFNEPCKTSFDNQNNKTHTDYVKILVILCVTPLTNMRPTIARQGVKMC